MDLRKVIGFPGYLMDVDDGTVWSFINGKRALKVTEHADGTKVVRLSCDGKSSEFTLYRLWYACWHNIHVKSIPKCLCVRLIHPGNELRLFYRHELTQFMIEEKQARLTAERFDLIRRKIYELELMQRTYKTGDWHELAAYIETLREDAIRWHCRRFGSSKDHASQYFDTAVGRMTDNLDNPHSTITDITAYLHRRMRDVCAETKDTRLQEFLDVLQFPEQPVIKPKRSVKL